MDVASLFSLRGSVAAVIGGTGTLGGAFCRGLASAGASVVVIGRSAERAAALAEEITAAGGVAMPLVLDVTRSGELEEGHKVITRRFSRVHLLVNAPGVNASTPFLELQDAEWERVLATNLTSVRRACQVFASGMIAAGGGGSIVNISSAAGEIPLSRVLSYSVSKAGINSLTRWLARELAPHRIRVNAIAPGFFPAEQNRRLLTPERVEAILRHTPLGRLGDPDELVGTLVWLASEKASSFVTGAIVAVDGGFTATTI
jgi:NAD(P)-dependent dehydrogenase (short-subunit alcohol dehydrogenase family)